jgi:hypothetical protein
MAQIVVRKFTCDRCNKPYNETETAGKDDGKSAKPEVIFVLESRIPNEKAQTMPEVVRFEDLCPKCSGRVIDLVNQIRLEKAEDKQPSSKPDGPVAEPAPATAPAVADATVKVDKTAEKNDNKNKGARAGGSAEPTTH